MRLGGRSSPLMRRARLFMRRCQHFPHLVGVLLIFTAVAFLVIVWNLLGRMTPTPGMQQRIVESAVAAPDSHIADDAMPPPPPPPLVVPPPQRQHPLVVLDWKRHPDLTREFVEDRIQYWNHVAAVAPPDTDLFPDSPTTQYITFELDTGGLNNKRMQFEIVVMLAFVMKRTLVLPDWDYWINMDGPSSVREFFDMDALGAVIPVIDLDEYLAAVEAPVELDYAPGTVHGPGFDDVRALQRARFAFLRDHAGAFSPKWDVSSQAIILGDSTRIPSADHFRGWRSAVSLTDLLHYRTLHMRSDYDNGFRLLGTASSLFYFPTLRWERYAHAFIRDSAHFIKDAFRQSAEPVFRLLHDVGPYNAVHIRRDDFGKQYLDMVISLDQLADNISPLLDPTLPLFVATDDRDRNTDEWTRFRAIYKQLRFLDDLLPADAVPKNNRGMIDQIVCSCAERFVGTRMSTFSANINRMRAFMGPSMATDANVYIATDHNTGYPSVDGWRTWSTWMDVPDSHWAKWSGMLWEREYFMSWDLH